jgi:putative DNA primase/helicase
MSPAAKMAQGHWKTILPLLGVDARFLKNTHGPCPICNGKDRFRWDDQNQMGGFICSQCGGGDGFDLVQKVTGQRFVEVAKAVAALLGTPQSYSPKPADTEEARNRENMQRIWEASQRPSEVGPVSAYLQRRLGCVWPSLSLREHVKVWSEGAFHFAMVAKVISHDDKAVNIHQTFLTQDGHKAEVATGKKVMAGKLPDGCAIRLAKAAPVMGVAEGIESAISAAILYDIPVWACINGGLLSKWIPPEVAEEIHIFGDNDANYTGQAKAYHLANRLEVQHKRKVTLVFPPIVGHDMNDVHRDMMLTREVSETYLRVIK